MCIKGWRHLGVGFSFIVARAGASRYETSTNWRHANKELNKLYLPKFYGMCVRMVWRQCAGQVITLHWISTLHFHSLFHSSSIDSDRKIELQRGKGRKKDWYSKSKENFVCEIKNHRWKKLKATNIFIYFYVEWQPASACFRRNELE